MIHEINNVLSLFDGMSCGQLALDKANIGYAKYYASEIDRFAIQIAQHNYPDTIQLGDVINLDTSELPKIDLLIGGSPCTSFSVAGNRDGFDGSSKLFYEFVRVLGEVKPKYFLLENVKMKQEWQDIITKHLGVKPIEIDSKLFSAQQRQRLYWTNIPINIFKLPTHNNTVIADILGIEPVGDRQHRLIINKKNTTKVKVRKHFVNTKDLVMLLRKHKEIVNKSLTQIAQELGLPKTHVEHWFRLGANSSVPDSEVWYKLKDILQIEDNSFDVPVTDFVMSNASFDSAKRVYHMDGKHPTLTTITGGGQRITVTDGTEMFLLSPEHCEKLQTVPVGYTSGVSNNQRFKMLGNAWTIDVVAFLLQFLDPRKFDCD